MITWPWQWKKRALAEEARADRLLKEIEWLRGHTRKIAEERDRAITRNVELTEQVRRMSER